ncbi:MAG: sugar transferase [Candidatus Uhrbacteria bacterium]|nr:sugar transferase [Candidatus Uhrbacteria bacterium]
MNKTSNDAFPAPVVLFVYNRPTHTRQTVEALSRNFLASDTVLHIYSDAARSALDAQKVAEVRSYIKQIVGFKFVTITERNQNIGLARSIIEGVTKVCNLAGHCIVIEDDLHTSQFFLTYMNEALTFYQNEPKVMHISGCRYPVKPFGSEDTFFLYIPLCWGWATWKRAWDTFEKDISIMERFSDKMIRRFDFEYSHGFFNQLALNKSGQLNTWFIFWYANIFLRGGLSLFPSISLVNNIGFDNSGVHCSTTSVYDSELCNRRVVISKVDIVESSLGYDSHVNYFISMRVGFWSRFKYYIKKPVKILYSLLSHV